MKTEQLIDCEGITLESAKPFAFSCCDCGLTHHMSIVSEDGRPVGFAVKRITESAPPAGEATDMLYCAMVELRYGSGDVTLTREMAAALLNQLEGTATQAQPSPHPAVVGSGGVLGASVAAPVGISRSEWIAQAKAFYVESGDDDATARECARYICNQQDWAGGEIGDPREEAQEDIHGRGRTGLAVLAASRVPVAVVVEPEHWDKLRRLGWRQYDCKVCGESWGAMSEPETPPMAVGAGGSVGAEPIGEVLVGNMTAILYDALPVGTKLYLATPATEQATTGSGQGMTIEEAKLLDATIEGFCDCGETDTPYEKLLDWANRGYLECERFIPLPAAQAAIDAARLSTASPAGGGEV